MFPVAGIPCWWFSSSASMAANRRPSGRFSQRPMTCMKSDSRNWSDAAWRRIDATPRLCLFLAFQFHDHFVRLLAVLEARPFRLECVLVDKRECCTAHVHVLVRFQIGDFH